METEMVHIPGRKGATRAVYGKDNPMLLVRKLLSENPRASVDEIQRLVCVEVLIPPGHPAQAYVDYAVANMVERVQKTECDNPRSKVKPVMTSQQREVQNARKIAAQAELATQAAALCAAYDGIKREAWRLEQVAPNGKAIGDCTGLECSQFSGYYKAIGIGVGANQKVRNVKNGVDLKNAETW